MCSECVSLSVWGREWRAVIRKWMSHFTGCLSLSFSLSGSLSRRGSPSCGQRWKWARPCSKCGDLVANPAPFPPLSPLNDGYCILPRRRMEDGVPASSRFALISQYGGVKEQRRVLILSPGDISGCSNFFSQSASDCEWWHPAWTNTFLQFWLFYLRFLFPPSALTGLKWAGLSWEQVMSHASVLQSGCSHI